MEAIIDSSPRVGGEGGGESSSVATLKLLEQETLMEERKLDDDNKQEHCIVVKNTPFKLRVAVLLNNSEREGERRKLYSFSLELQLIYAPNNNEDSNEDGMIEKPVDFIRKKPLQYVVTPLSEVEPLEFLVESKIKILSSQHEDMMFCLKVLAKENRNMVTVKPVLSKPIRVVSKPPRLLKKKTTSALLPQQLAEDYPKKRSYHQMAIESIDRIEELQEQQKSEVNESLSHIEKSLECITSWLPSEAQQQQQQQLRVEDVDFFLSMYLEKILREFGLLMSQEEKVQNVKNIVKKANRCREEIESLVEIIQTARREMSPLINFSERSESSDQPPPPAYFRPTVTESADSSASVSTNNCTRAKDVLNPLPFCAPTSTTNVRIPGRSESSSFHPSLVTLPIAATTSTRSTSTNSSSPINLHCSSVPISSCASTYLAYPPECAHQRELANINAIFEFIKTPPL